MTISLPPSEHIIDSSKVSSYEQSPHGLCYFFTFISSISNAIARKYDCSLQISAWDFIKCMESFFDADDIVANITAKTYDLKFIADPPVSFEKTYNDQTIIKIQAPSSDIDRILFDKIFSTNQDFVIDDVYTILPKNEAENILLSLLPGKIFLDVENGGIDPKFKDKWTRGKLYITNINTINSLGLDDIVNYGYQVKTTFNTAKTNYINSNKTFGYEQALFFINLLRLTNFPLKITCGKFNDDPEATYNANYESNINCFKKSECSLDIGFIGDSRGLDINNLDEVKILLSNDKTIIWDAPPFITKVLTIVDNCNRALNSGESLQEYIDSVKNYSINLIKKTQCKNFGKALDLILDCIQIIFSQGPLNNIIDLSKINYFIDAKIPELSIFCDDDISDESQKLNIGSSHVMMIYGYKEISDSITDLYIKNTWSGSGVTSDKFIVRIKNNTILQDEKISGLGRFGNFKCFLDKDIIIENKTDICDCCEPSPSISSSSSIEDDSPSSSSPSSIYP